MYMYVQINFLKNIGLVLCRFQDFNVQKNNFFILYIEILDLVFSRVSGDFIFSMYIFKFLYIANPVFSMVFI